MNLFVISKVNGKVQLSTVAENRFQMACKIGGKTFTIGTDEIFHVNDVFAEKEIGSMTNTVAVIGAIVGLLAGPIGILIGACIGGILGSHEDYLEKLKVDNFNSSIYINQLDN